MTACGFVYGDGGRWNLDRDMRGAADKSAAPRISFYMELISKIIEELGGDEAHAFTVCPGQLAHFRGVKSVSELTAEKIVLICGKKIITCEGKNLTAAEYFQGDMTVSGNITGINIE